MNVAVLKGAKVKDLAVDTLAVGYFSGAKDKFLSEVDDLTGGSISRHLTKNKKFGKLFEAVTFFVPPRAHKAVEKIVVFGLGKADKLDNLKLRQVSGNLGKVQTKSSEKVAVYFPKEAKIANRVDLVVIGFASGAFDPGHFKSQSEESKSKETVESLAIVSDESVDGKLVEKGLVISNSMASVREIVNSPANVVTPEAMVSFAKKIAAENKLKIEVFSEEQVKKMGMGIMASVARGSDLDLYFVVMRYMGAGSAGPTVAIVGKGITFDSGGISIKPSDSMEWMKMDMAGAAACFGVMDIVGKLKPKVNIICACPLTENLPSGKATKPGDVVTGLSGKTVEVINTDAEGRLVLSDALTYVQKNFKPDYIVDVATLTGAVQVALGNLAAGAMGRPQKFVEEVIASGATTGERIWQLPLYEEYRELLKSYIADIANVSAGRGAGAETGAKFLEEFVDEKQPWVHLDIGSTAWEESEKPYTAKGATGFAVTTLVDLSMNLAKREKTNDYSREDA